MYIFLLLLIPAIEIWLFITLGQSLGVLSTILLCIVTAGIGITLVRFQGILALKSLAMQSPGSKAQLGNTLVQGGLLLVAGVSLLIPGFFSDAIGFLLLIPLLRRKLSSFIEKRFKVSTPTTGTTPHDDKVIDGEYTVCDEKTPKSPQDSPWLSKHNTTL